VTINGFSSHAGQEGLLAYAKATQDTVKKVFLVHGEPRGAEPLREKLIGAGFKDVLYPEPGAEFDL